MTFENIWLGILGEPIIKRDGRQSDLPPAKAVALLALLALSDAPPTRDQVITLLWPERDVTVGRKDLRNTLWQLRQALGAAAIVASGDHLALAAQIVVDGHEFAASGDLALYRGPLLTNLVLRAAPEFEMWLDRERERWLACYLAKLTEAITRARSSADWQQLAHLARNGLQHAPYDETLHQALLEALARQGRRDEASRHYARLHDLLAHDLAMQPLAATTALYERILAGAFAPTLALPTQHLPSPYDPSAAASQQLSMGWQLAGQGAPEAAARQFIEAGMALAAMGDWYGATLAYAEIAALALAADDYPALRTCVERARGTLGDSIAPALQRLVHCLDGMRAAIDDAGVDTDALRSGKQLVLSLLQAARMDYGYQVLRQQGAVMPLRASQAACALLVGLGAHPLSIDVDRPVAPFTTPS